MIIYKTLEFAAAHKICAKGYKGKCKNLHGHNYKVEVWIKDSVFNLTKFGMLADFTDIKKVVMELDHKYLNDIVDKTKPTAENISIWIVDELERLFRNPERTLITVRVWETSTSYSEFDNNEDL